MKDKIIPESCPDCAGPLFAVSGYPSWCGGCDWGVAEPPEPERVGLVRSRFERWSARMVETLYEEVSRSPARRPGWDGARVASYALALCVHACTVALLGLAVWLMVGVRNPVTVVVAIVAVLLAFAVRPRLGSLRKDREVRYRADAPALFGLLDRVAAELGAAPVHAVVASAAYNAGYATIGLRRRRVLVLGLPLWETLSGQEKIALLGHEFAHGVNGDSRHGLIVSTSLSTLERLQSLLRPGRRDYRVNYLVDLMTRLLQAALTSTVGWVFVFQKALVLRAGQRAEYLADDLAARLASPEAAAQMLDALMVGQATYLFTAHQYVADTREPVYWDRLSEALAILPESERERRRRAAARRQLRVDESHPPTHLRISVLRKRVSAEPRLVMATGEEEQIRSELVGDYDRLARQLHDTAQARLYRG
ncbi:M48 family metalloprotease [Actinomadura scrupuli]|uniref:M48 family metallopeptidase n=1 Tax=Actinomadura scrupuli TaxID=559629 RepID=UPI003D977044